MPAPKDQLKVIDWGLIDYRQALTQQEALVEEVSETKKGFLVTCSHPPVVTLGRKSTPEDLVGWSGETIETSRGGRATYHGPSQLVIYPILPIKDVHAYLRSLETAIVKALNEIGVQGKTSVEQAPGKSEDLNNTGVWVEGKKIASIGIAIRKWVSFHGLALNVDHDPEAFKGINPCGFSQSTMTSVETVLGRKVDRVTLTRLLVDELKKGLT